MKRTWGRWKRTAVIALLLVSEGGRGAAMAGNPFIRRVAPKSCLEQAAEQIDRLEHKLQNEGSVVVKAPDVWGESRLTKHRQEFERVLEAKVDEFQLMLNGSIRRSDQAFLANSLAIQAALTSSVQPPTVGQAQTDLAIVNALTPATAPVASGSATDTPIQRNLVAAAGVNTSRFVDSFQDNNVLNIGLEPTIALDQLKRYLDHLNEIRRVNEGDDTSDSPGYSLNLVRIPVSILPGDKTRKGYGAEVTVTATPHLSPELLPRVFRELVINDLVDVLGASVLKTAEAIDEAVLVEKTGCSPQYRAKKEMWLTLSEAEKLEALLFESDSPANANAPMSAAPGEAQQMLAPSVVQEPVAPRSQKAARAAFGFPLGGGAGAAPSPSPDSLFNMEFRNSLKATSLKEYVTQTSHRGGAISPSAAGVARNARGPFSPTQSTIVLGQDELIVQAYEFWKARPMALDRHLPDARAFLAEQLQAGYDYLSTPEGMGHWQLVPEIYEAVRSDRGADLESLRRKVVKPYTVRTPQGWVAAQAGNDMYAPSAVTSCAWWILVESALLNQHLNDDVKRVSQDPDCQCACAGPQAFYSADPPLEARMAFIDYVKCRWPIHVFALDPVVQQQNISDQFSLRRELQLALAMSFAAGRANMQNVTRYARRLEIDMETIALNRTDVAFGHGSDTFGWRFTPRVQSPPFEGNAKVFVRDLLVGGPTKDQITRTWELEAGQRECVAIVLMPSFIEHVTFQARGNFFRMADCKHDVFPPRDVRTTLAENVRWSEEVKLLDDTLNQLHCEATRFLPGEVSRVQARATQLTRRFPLQTVHSRVPNENTLGGFEMFSSGVTDLGPELLDFYGEPGIDVRKDTTLFLVGNHFSVHDTHVVAGHRECKFQLISREVMKVTIPAGTEPALETVDNSQCRHKVIDVHVATPYGVTSHLHIPVIEAGSCCEARLEWNSRDIAVKMPYTVTPETAMAKAAYEIQKNGILLQPPHELAITVPPYSLTDSANFSVEVVLGTDSSVVQIADLGGPFTAVSFDPARRQFVVAGGKYRTVITSIADGVQTYLNALPKGATAPQTLDLRLLGRATDGSEVEGAVHFLIRLEQVR